ncbi:monocarboxylate transporter 9-like isoform X2 [Ostrea edulis]|uniref:monocarboxylate transporter 9-like isoform X2 n=1 Tax=Ostrea edulis TaxID=37623 RepID=UPI0024AE9479|nr:monocarboxylate transporter 9-like isoform X2 [Ostrea edulis]XP_056004946.1 monocarboxylate transporter 9-like isoform X2 [Ostrea edulis]
MGARCVPKALPVTVFGTEKFGCRPFVIYGGCALFVGYLLSSIAPNIEIVMLAQGVIAASGSASIHPPSLIILGRYFDKRRGFANGLAVAAGSLGGFVTPVVFTKLMEEYSVRGALLIQSALLFNIVAAASLFRPTELTAKMYQFEAQKHKRKECYEALNTGDLDEKLTNGSLLMIKEIKNGVEHFQKEENGTCKPMLVHSAEHLSIKQIPSPSLSHLRRRIEHHHSNSTLSQFSSIHSILSPSIADIHIESTTKQHNSESATKCSCTSTLLKIMDVRMLKNKLIALFTIVFCFGSVGTCLGVIFVAPFARDKNLTKDEIAITTGLIFGSEFVFRIILGLFADMNIVERYRIVQVSLFGTGAVLLSSPFMTSFWHFVMFSIAYGFFSGPLISMYSPVCIDFVGMEKFHRVIGILMSFQGIFLGGLGPTVGIMRDRFDSYIPAFQMLAAFTIVGAFLLFFIPCLRKQEVMDERDVSISEEETKE